MAIAWLDPKRARRGWAGLFLASLVVVAFAVADYDFGLTIPDDSITDAVSVPDHDWVFGSGDVPGTWAAFEGSDAYARIVERAPELRPQLDAWMRVASGFRLTPTRWNLWLGRRFLVSGKDNDAVVSIRATQLLKGALAVARWTGLAQERDGILALDGAYCARVKGLLLIGTSAGIVKSTRDSGKHWSYFQSPVVELEIGSRAMNLFVNDSRELESRIWLGRVEHDVPLRPEYFSMEWPEQPIVSVVTRGLEPDAILPQDEWPEFPGSADLKKAWDDFEKLLPVDWREGSDTTQFALFDVDTSETVPVPVAAVFARSETVLGPLTPPDNAIPFEWSGASGWMTPWLGEGFNLFVAADDRSRVFANQEATMARVMAQRRQGRIASDDARVEIDAGRLAQVLTDLVRRAAKNELVPERNADDVEADVVPWLKAFGALGEIRYSGKYDADGLTLHGTTQPPVEKESAR